MLTAKQGNAHHGARGFRAVNEGGCDESERGVSETSEKGKACFVKLQSTRKTDNVEKSRSGVVKGCSGGG